MKTYLILAAGVATAFLCVPVAQAADAAAAEALAACRTIPARMG